MSETVFPPVLGPVCDEEIGPDQGPTAAIGTPFVRRKQRSRAGGAEAANRECHEMDDALGGSRALFAPIWQVRAW